MRPNVLFLCTGNSCLSQMAEGWAHRLLSDQMKPYSAGIEAHAIDLVAIRVMLELGVDISRQRSKLVNSLADVPFDLVVTVCGDAAEKYRTFLGKAGIIHAAFDDPTELAMSAATEDEAMGHYRRVRDEIRTFVEHELFIQLPHRHLIL